MVDTIKEKYMGALPDPVSFEGTLKIADQMNNCICIIYNEKRKGTGFFVKIPYKSNLLPVLITSNQEINKDDILNMKNISIYINNDKKIKTLKLNRNRKIYTNEKCNITIIEIKENEDNLNNKYLELEDEIINYLKFNKKGIQNHLYNLNNIYSNESIYILNHPNARDIFASYGKISHLHNTNIFYQCSIKDNAKEYFSVSPILLINNQKLLGIHEKNSKKYSKGNLLIYSIYEFSKIKNNLLLINNERYTINNYIIAEFDIKEDNQKIRIINCYEKARRENEFIEYEKRYENEVQIKDNCEIRINGKLIPFSYFHKFNKKGKYTIKYYFLLNITKTNYMFYGCSSLININLSNFNTNNVKYMNGMFSGCKNLNKNNIITKDKRILNECKY